MAQKSKNQNMERNQSVGEAVSKVELFFKNNTKKLIIATSAVLVAALLIVAYFLFIVRPQKKEAVNQMFVAEQFFRAGNYETALNGDGNALGFTQIIDEYGNKAGQSVYFYAGICELQLGNGQKAIDYLKKYDTKDVILMARAISCIGDAYVILENNQSALDHYIKAAKHADNPFSAAYYLKAGQLCEEMG
jgi:tetratricopeptide (TPR) repeat protein